MSEYQWEIVESTQYSGWKHLGMEASKILYFCVEGENSIDQRNLLIDALEHHGFNNIECSGGQAAFDDGDLEEFTEIVLGTAREQNPPIDVQAIFRLNDPGLGMVVGDVHVLEGLASGSVEIPNSSTYERLSERQIRSRDGRIVSIPFECVQQMIHGRVVFPNIAIGQLLQVPIANVVY
jgi:hypothetical protein